MVTIIAIVNTAITTSSRCSPRRAWPQTTPGKPRRYQMTAAMASRL